MITAIKKAFGVREGKINLLLMTVCFIVLLLMSGLDIGKYTFVLFMFPSFLALYFGDRFVKLAVYFMMDEDK